MAAVIGQAQNGRVTRYEIRDRTGALWAVHVRVNADGGKRMWWEAPDGSQTLGMPAADLPLYGIERLASNWCVITEGEKSAQALLDAGTPAVATVGSGSIWLNLRLSRGPADVLRRPPWMN